MKNIKHLTATCALLLALSVPALAGDQPTIPVAPTPQPPTNGTSSTGSTTTDEVESDSLESSIFAVVTAIINTLTALP